MTRWQRATTFIPLRDDRDLMARIAHRYLLLTVPSFCIGYAMLALGYPRWLHSASSFCFLVLPLFGGYYDWRMLQHLALVGRRSA